ncbi:hypothetical protein OS189_17020 [Sulfitobacter sp. F26169L]|uniref:hypothetical protein n=1 Tax=Sulfitobacter sp. F26169L TaxID=2996015 RepID=UPI002260F637|nr:hypothetical protein [Sulfitobacter sp. F26169L]MCX7568047.1 hypothetical protein [Sulfitobacter sp. F26169L]
MSTGPDPLEIQQMLRAEILRLRTERAERTDATYRQETEHRHATELVLARIGQTVWFNGPVQGTPKMEEQLDILQKSDLFEAKWYLARDPDLAGLGISAAEHYLRAGAFEGRDPGPQFSSMEYYLANPDVARAGWPALLHYIQHGQAEKRPLVWATAKG